MHDGRIVGTLPPDGIDLERQFFRTVEAAASGVRPVRTAILAELVKLGRSAIGRLVTVLLAVAVPAMAAGFVAAAESGGSSQVAVKVRPLVHGVGWDALTGTTGQVTSIAMLLGVGFVVSWTFGREFSDGAIETLLMTRPSRAVLASAKLIAVLVLGFRSQPSPPQRSCSGSAPCSVSRPGRRGPGSAGRWSGPC